ncbi:50S ribosomal protein L13 (chloroplast) [Nannochloropsis gaditana]|uniref:Large ribosomal subunit protein uL13c n=1 Tax=Nannochloropsis gaditana TaxID=72520 RepID=K9ZVB5_9STRA|nr:50S ribosomal protein L13 [Nannochloropsis gaditana]AFZ64272.1 50S ribosomal protein L13 [Nannochloropsis gaditana]AGI98624.1 ribosomal protein L13 [Nannochloropsis gaditana]AHX25149.1 50S ribosomal protein L13 [Nannochloropsis gaditana]
MNDTYIPLGKYKEKSWYLVDAQGQTLGRLSTQIANLIQGKTQVSYTPGSDSKVYVVVVNADKIKVTGNKLKQKFYYTHTGKPGELKTRSLAELLSRFPYRVIELAVKRMLPNGFEKSDLAKRLRVYAGNEHPHKAQKPKEITFGK